MKRLLISFFIICACGVSAKEPFFAHDTKWHYLETDCFAQTSRKKTYSIKDSVVNGIEYQYVIDALLRTDGAKVWCVVDSLGKNVEQLLYNFDLQVGDSIQMIDFPEYDPSSEHPFAKITKVITITLSDGRIARRLSYDIRNDDIEYVGNIRGLLNAAQLLLPPCGIVEDFVCCTREEDILYEIASGACDILSSVEQVTADQSSHQPASATKLLRDGQLLIMRDGKTYTVTGLEVK